MLSPKPIHIYCDGGSRGNPGPAASGVAFTTDDGELLATFHQYVGITTNNQAEYRAVVLALEKMKQQGVTSAHFFLDSQLVVRQLNGQYRVKNPDLLPIYRHIKSEIEGLDVNFTHVPRAQNKLADREVNICLDNLDKRV